MYSPRNRSHHMLTIQQILVVGILCPWCQTAKISESPHTPCMSGIGSWLAEVSGMNGFWVFKFKCSVESKEDGSRPHITTVVPFIYIRFTEYISFHIDAFISSSWFCDVGVVMPSLQMKESKVSVSGLKSPSWWKKQVWYWFLAHCSFFYLCCLSS